MPKLAIDQSMSVSITDIQAQVNKIQYLLKGRVAGDNIYERGLLETGIQTKKVVNSVDETKPIEGFKVFGYFRPDEKTFLKNVLNPLLEEKRSNIQPRVLEGHCSFIFNNSTMEKSEPIEIGEKDVQYSGFQKGLDVAGDFLQTVVNTPANILGAGSGGDSFLSSGGRISLDESVKIMKEDLLASRRYPDSWERRVIKIPKTPFIRIMSKSDVNKITGWNMDRFTDDYYLSYTFYSDYEVAIFQNNIKAEIVREDPDMIEVAVYFSTIGFDQDDFFTLQVGVEILCKEVL